MPALHIVNHPSGLESCLGVAGSNDTVLLIDAAVHSDLSTADRALVLLAGADTNVDIPDTMDKQIHLIDYAGFVDLVVTHQPIVSWS